MTNQEQVLQEAIVMYPILNEHIFIVFKMNLRHSTFSYEKENYYIWLIYCGLVTHIAI